MAVDAPHPPVLSRPLGKRIYPGAAAAASAGTWSSVGGSTPAILQSEDDSTSYVVKTSAGANDYALYPAQAWAVPSNEYVVGVRPGCDWYNASGHGSIAVRIGQLSGSWIAASALAAGAGNSYVWTDVAGTLGAPGLVYYYYAELGGSWQYTDLATGQPWTSTTLAQLGMYVYDKATLSGVVSRFTAAYLDIWAASIPLAPVISTPSGTVTDTLTPAVSWVHTDTVSATVTNRASTGTTRTLTFASHTFQVDNLINVATGLANYDGTAYVTATTSTTVTYTAPNGASLAEGTTAQAGTVTFGDGSTQAAFEVKVFTAAQYGAGGFSPDTSTPTWSIAGTGSTASVNTPSLVNGTTYRAYVRTAKTTGQRTVYSPWAFSGFTMSVTLPPTPTLTATLDNANQRVTLAFAAFGNLLSAQTASLETAATVGGWAATTNCTVTQSATFADTGAGSLRLSSTAAGTMSASTEAVPAVVGAPYSATVRIRSAIARTCNVLIDWLDSAGATLSTTTGATAASTTTGFTTYTVTGTAPASAVTAKARVQIASTAAGAEFHYVDTIALHPGSTPAWMPGGATFTATVARTQAGTTSTVRATALDAAERGAWADYEASRAVAVTYVATLTATYSTGFVVTVVSATTASITPSNDGTNWFKAPLNPVLNIGAGLARIKKGTLSFRREEDMGVMRPLGRSKAVVVAGDMEGEDGGFSLHALTATEWANLYALLLHQAPLLWQEPDGTQKYIRVTSPREWTQTDGWTTPRHLIAVQYVETDAP